MSDAATTKLTIFLMRSGAIDFERISKSARLPWNTDYRRLEVFSNPGYQICAFLDPGIPSPPRWLSFIQDHFRTDGMDLNNKKCSLILFVAIGDEVLAVTFGGGFHLISRDTIVPRFGLLTTLNNLNASKIETVDAGNLDSPGKQKRTHITEGRPIHEHDIDSAIDWIRMISGKSSKQNEITRYHGADSLGIVCKISLNNLGTTCSRLVEEYEGNSYKENFAFIDHIVPVKDPNLRKVLDLAMHRMLLQPQRSGHISITLPDAEYGSAVNFQMSYKRNPLAYDELNISAVQSYLRHLGAQNVDDGLINSINVSPLNADGETVARDRLRDYLVAQIEYDDRNFIHCYGEWFEADPDYLSKVESRVMKIVDMSNEFNLPDFGKSDTEEIYNKKLASARDWLLLDKKNITLQTYDKVEACDLLTKEGDFICVKNLASSKHMSHLFAQASVSASLIRDHQPFFDKVATQYRNKWPGVGLSRDKLVFVLAIATDKDGPVAGSLPFFSAINLLNHERKIRLSGYDLVLCKIRVPPKMPVGRRRQRKPRRSVQEISATV